MLRTTVTGGFTTGISEPGFGELQYQLPACVKKRCSLDSLKIEAGEDLVIEINNNQIY
jgi:hypothetical protein